MEQIWLAMRSSFGIAAAVIALPALLLGIGAALFTRVPVQRRPLAVRAFAITTVVMALAVIGVVTLTPAAYPIHAVTVTPFSDVLAAIRSGSGLSRSLLNCAGNAALYVPLGMSLGLLRRSSGIGTAFAAGALTSILIESIQYAPAIGRATDITDVLMNTAGAVTGWAACRWVRGRWAAHDAVCGGARAVTPTP